MITDKAEELNAIVDGAKAAGKKVVLCTGAFDILHVGHARFLDEAKRQGDVLIVGLNSDSSIKKYKSEARPINAQAERAELLSAFSAVDHVVIFDEEDPRELIKAVKPDIYCNGIEYGEDCIERPVLDEIGSKLHLIERHGDYSTTKLIATLKRNA